MMLISRRFTLTLRGLRHDYFFAFRDYAVLRCYGERYAIILIYYYATYAAH